MTALQGAMESTARVSRLHLRQSFELADFPAPARRELVSTSNPEVTKVSAG
jgi:hypothetical protein